MKDKLTKLASSLHPARLSGMAAYLLRDEAISGKLIVGATILALIAANTTLGSVYENFWHTRLDINLADWSLSKDLRDWVNEGLMAIFFLVVGLELKREIATGELRKFKTAALPFGAAIGGMIIPALIYISLNNGLTSVNGWAIPMATDIAFAVGILAFAGARIVPSIRLFLLTLAIVDDIGAVIVIAIFYSTGISIPMLLVFAILAALVMLLQKLRLLTLPLFIVLAILLWLALDASGVHASIAGALAGLLAPVAATTQKKAVSERLEKLVIPISTLLVIPLFAFANTGIKISTDSLSGANALPVAGGIILGLAAGKVIGILGASWLMVKLKLANLPKGATWKQIAGVGFLAGIGFTVSIFVTGLAFDNQQMVDTAKISIFVASVISGVLGLYVLKSLPKR